MSMRGPPVRGAFGVRSPCDMIGRARAIEEEGREGERERKQGMTPSPLTDPPWADPNFRVSPTPPQGRGSGEASGGGVIV